MEGLQVFTPSLPVAYYLAQLTLLWLTSHGLGAGAEDCGAVAGEDSGRLWSPGMPALGGQDSTLPPRDALPCAHHSPGPAQEAGAGTFQEYAPNAHMQ